MRGSRERRAIKFVVYGLIVVFVIAFAVFQSKGLITGPEIIIREPLDGETVENPLIKVSGQAQNISELKLDGRQIFTDENGNFSEEILLSYGYNTIVIEAEDRFGRGTREELELILK